MTAIEFKLCPHVAGREIGWRNGAIVAEIVVDGFRNGGWVYIFAPKSGALIGELLWARSRTHAHELVEARAA